MEHNESESEKTSQVLYIIQEQVLNGPREFASAYDKSYQTRAVCTTEEIANRLASALSQDESAPTLIILKVPVDQVFPKGLPPGTHINTQAPGSSSQLHAASTNTDDHNDDLDDLAKAHILEHLQVAPEVYERDRKIREAEMMQRRNIQPLPVEQTKHKRTT